MKNFFSVDGALYKFLENLSDYVFLNLAFVLTCIPVMTIGASLTALFDMTARLQKGEKFPVFKTYFESFRKNFKIATSIWAIQFIIYMIVIMYLIMFNNPQTLFSQVYYVFTVVVAYLNLAISIYIYPTISRYENTIGGYFSFAFVSSNIYFLYTILMIGIAVVIVLLSFNSVMTIGWGLFVYLLIGFALIAYVYNLILKRVFEKMEKKDEA